MADPDRALVWTAMADLFLDTDVRLHFAHVARVAAASSWKWFFWKWFLE